MGMIFFYQNHHTSLMISNDFMKIPLSLDTDSFHEDKVYKRIGAFSIRFLSQNLIIATVYYFYCKLIRNMKYVIYATSWFGCDVDITSMCDRWYGRASTRMHRRGIKPAKGLSWKELKGFNRKKCDHFNNNRFLKKLLLFDWSIKWF